ncbi:MAG: DUF87 domain-containing protein, partial [Nitrososphaerota archaeon]
MTLTEFKKIVYERIEISSLRKIEQIKNFKILGMNIILNKNSFNISNRNISEIRINSIDNENINSNINMLRGLCINNFEGMFSLSYEPFNYEIRFSIINSLNNLNLEISKIKSCILSSYPNSEIEILKPSIENVTWPIGGIPISKYKNSLIVLRNSKFSSISFLLMKINDILNIENGLENSLISSIESNCSFRFCIPIKSYNGILSSFYLFLKKKKILSEYSKIYKELEENRLFNIKNKFISYDIDKSNKINYLYNKYEKLNKEIGYWKCSPIIVVIGPPSINIKEAYKKQRKYLESIKASFSSSYNIKIKEINFLNLNSIAKNLLCRKILNNKINLTNEELSLFINIPNIKIPSISYINKKNIEFYFDINEINKNGILLGYYEYSNNKLKIKIGIEDLPLHLAIFGVPGSGKTTLAKKLIRKYINLGGNVMIFDRHGEYNDFEDFIILNSNNLRINLFENNNYENHAKILSEIFSMAYPDEFGPLVSSIFRRMYLKYIFNFDNHNLISFIYFIEKSLNEDIIFKSNKAKDKAFSLLSRLSELAEGEIGKIFNCSQNEIKIESILNNNVIFDLKNLDTERDSNILTWIILKKVYDYRKKNKNIGLPHIILCEEAHNIVPFKFEGKETIIEKMLKEMRKFNESIWIIDQRPINVSRDILALCGT